MASGKGSTGSALHAFIKERFGAGDRLYGVVDAARDYKLAFAGRDEFGWKIRWLFADDAAAHMTDVAPYLVPIEFAGEYPHPGSGYLDMWAERLGSSAGVLFLTKVDMDETWEHLRSLFSMQDEDGKDVYVRFYDPRVLRTLLGMLIREKARVPFGPIHRVFVESARPGYVMSCGPRMRGVEIDEVLVE